jgi:hypothetical protein
MIAGKPDAIRRQETRCAKFGPPLRAHRERPRDRHAAEQRDELATLQLIELHATLNEPVLYAAYPVREDQSGVIGAA